MFEERRITRIAYLVLLITGIIATIYVAIASFSALPAPLFLLPLSFTICCCIFRNIIPYHRGGYGLKVLYTVFIVRYLVIPILTCSNNLYSELTKYSSEGLCYGVIIQVVELIVTCIVIKHSFIKIYNKCASKYTLSSNRHYYDDLSIGGLLVILFSIYVIASRGLDKILESMRFLVISQSIEEEALYGYDIWVIHTLMAFLVIVMCGTFQRKEDKKPSVTNALIPLLFAFLSCSLSFGNNRMTSVYYAVSALSVLFMAFPKRKYLITSIVLPTAVIVIVSFTMMKQFGFDVTSGGNAGVGDDDLVTTLSAYVSTTQNVAKAYDMYVSFGNKWSIDCFFSGFFNGIVILQLPLFQNIFHSILSVPTTISLASTGTEVVPMAGQTLFYGGYFFGWVLDIIFFIVLVRFLIITDSYSKLEKRVGNKYLYTWISLTFGMAMTYNLSIIWNSLNYTPFFTIVALWVNRTFRIKKQLVH